MKHAHREWLIACGTLFLCALFGLAMIALLVMFDNHA